MGDLAPATISVAIGALVFAMLVGIPLGLAWSRWRRVRFLGTPFVYLMFGLIQVWVAIFLSCVMPPQWPTSDWRMSMAWCWR